MSDVEQVSEISISDFRHLEENEAVESDNDTEEIELSDDSEESEENNSEDDFVPEASPMMVVSEEDGFDMPSDEHRKKIIEVGKAVQRDYIEICKLLYQAQKKRRYESWGFASFKDYAQKELGFKYSRAKALADLGLVAYRDSDIFTKMITLGIDKAYEIKRIATKENIDDWIEKGKQLNADDLKKEVRREILSLVPKDPEEALASEGAARETPVVEQMHRKSFNFTYENLQTLNQAIVILKQANNHVMTDEEAIALICSEFLGTNVQGQSSVDFALNAVKKYETFFPINLIVVTDPARDQKAPEGSQPEIVHGYETLKALVMKEIS